MSRPTVYRRYRKLLPAVALSVFVLGFSDYGRADEATGYESYFGDEVISASCGLDCIERWIMKPTFRCQVEIDDQHNLKCKAVVLCVIVNAKEKAEAKVVI